MRKLLIPLLLAGAGASPAMAQQFDRPDRQHAREEREQARENRIQAREESRSDRPRIDAPRPVQSQRVVTPQEQRFDRPAGVQTFGGGPHDVDARIGRRDQLRQERIDARELRQSARPVPNVMRNRPLVVSNVPRPGTQPPLRIDNRRSQPVQWSTNWRHNNRYDWAGWRNSHRSLFRLGYYYDPFGWGYQPYSIGWRMWPSYYSNRFWINDPWMYRLPYAPAGYQWIRYWDDAILVDTWTGTVVDVIPNFFW